MSGNRFTSEDEDVEFEGERQEFTPRTPEEEAEADRELERILRNGRTPAEVDFDLDNEETDNG